MKNIFKIFILSLIIILSSVSWSQADDEDINRPKIRAGTFAKVIVLEEISTLTGDTYDGVKFLNTQDMYVYETNAIPENTIFYGEIEDIREPVEGRNASIKIYIYKMITPDKKVYNLDAHIYSEDDNYVGGEQTNSVYYRKVPHYYSTMRPILQVTPLNIYEMGQHKILKSGDELFVIFEKDVYLK